jgi:acyl phosphate:glycerol-3-phosphate acyltransferase
MLAPLIVLGGYLLGSAPFGYWVVRMLRGEDIRTRGSGNIGATNVLRTAGWVPAVLTLGLDIGKGYAAVAAGAAIAPDLRATAACVVAAIVGNCWTVFLGFRGGKGVATGLGALLRVVPLAVLPAVPVWLAIAITTRYVSLGSILGAACVPLGAVLLGYPAPLTLAALAAAVLIILRHHANIARLLAGQERRLGAKRNQA